MMYPVVSETAATSEMSEYSRERESLIHNLMDQIHLMIEMISGDRPCAMEV